MSTVSSPTKLQKFKNVFTSNGSCGCKKSIDAVDPEPKSRTSDPNVRRQGSKVEKSDGGATPSKSERQKAAAIGDCKIFDSLAIVKDSEDPYSDFLQSMKQMMEERKIDKPEDQKMLLECFLGLNPSRHHEIIVRAFKEVCEAHAQPQSAPETETETETESETVAPIRTTSSLSI